MKKAYIPAALRREVRQRAQNKCEYCLLAELFMIERNRFMKADELLNFMRKSQGRYSYQGDQLLFKSTRDAETFNTLLREVQVFAEQETEWKAKAMRRSQEDIESLKRGTKR